MSENRRSRRVTYCGSAWLHHNEARYTCLLENISKNGVLVTVKAAPDAVFHPGDACRLKLRHEEDVPDYQHVEACIVRLEGGKAALEFADMEFNARVTLDALIQKELQFHDGGQKLIELGREVAVLNGVDLTAVHFNKGNLNPDREVQTLRFLAGEHSINVHLHREEIEAFHVPDNAEQTKAKIYHAIERLNA